MLVSAPVRILEFCMYQVYNFYIFEEHMCPVRRKPILRYLRFKQACSAQKTSKIIEVLHGARFITFFPDRRGNNKGADQTVQMHRLVYAFIVRIQQCQVFLRRGPYNKGADQNA